MRKFYNMDTGHFSDSYNGEAGFIITSEELLLQILRRVKQLEKQIESQTSNKTEVLSGDENEFDSKSIDALPEMTVSPSNFEKIKNVQFGGTIKVSCMDERTEVIIVRNSGEFEVQTKGDSGEITTEKSIEKKKSRAKKQRGNMKKKNKISTKKNTFSRQKSTVSKEREDMIKKGIVIPVNKQNNENHNSGNQNSKYWKPKFDMDRSYI